MSLPRQMLWTQKHMPIVKCVTMQRDESVLLDAWLRYHGYLFGFTNLTVIDNGSVLPEVLSTLQYAEDAGVRVYRQFPTTSDYGRKGVITADVIRAIDHQEDYDFVLPLDCDEFFALWIDDGLTVDRTAIHGALDELDPEDLHFRITDCAYNDPGRPGWFWPQPALKGFMRARSIEMLDHGNHTFSENPHSIMRECRFTHLHFHHKPLDVVQQHTLWKLAPFVDVNDTEAVQAFTGPGIHLLRNLGNTPAEYHRQFEDHLTFRHEGFGRVARLLGLSNPMFHIDKTDSTPAGTIRVRLPRDIAGGQSSGHGIYITFDPKLYLHQNLDVAAAGDDPLQHYLLMGFKEGRQFSP